MVRARDGQPRLRRRPRPPGLGDGAGRGADGDVAAPARPRPGEPGRVRGRPRRDEPLVTEYGIDYIKWDHNRDLHEAVRTDGSGADRPASTCRPWPCTGCSTSCARRHPRLEIESCSSGGARVDLGILARTDRVWASDCNDALERVAIQRWTGLLVPPERMGSHIGPPRAHTTHRDLDLSLRMLVALGGHAGLEWDISRCSEAELDALRRWSALYRELRPLVHGGDVVRSDHPDPTLTLDGVVAPDRAEAVFTVVQTASGRGVTPGLLPLPGLDPARRYRVRVRPEAGLPETVQNRGPHWFHEACGEGVDVSGDLLGAVGLPLPVWRPPRASCCTSPRRREGPPAALASADGSSASSTRPSRRAGRAGGVPRGRGLVGAPPALRDVRSRRVLRQLPGAARHRALPRRPGTPSSRASSPGSPGSGTSVPGPSSTGRARAAAQPPQAQPVPGPAGAVPGNWRDLIH